MPPRLTGCMALACALGCDSPRGDVPTTPASDVRRIDVRGRSELTEGSAAVMSRAQPGVVFIINDSGHEPVLFAVDTTGADRGAWWVEGARNADWEAMSLGPCRADQPPDLSSSGDCLYIGDVGDNDERRPTRTIYRVPEPRAGGGGLPGRIPAEALTYRYSDGPHDVEAIYVGPDSSVRLVTKRPRRDAGKELRPALVFELPSASWDADSIVTARLVDSLAIVPGSANDRTITDAALSPDGRLLAVRTYAEVWVFATDSAGRVRREVAAAVCDIARVERGYGEGVTWLSDAQRFLLTHEGRNAPMYVVTCPLPQGATVP